MKPKQTALYLAGIIAILFALSSCKKYLEEKPNKNLVSPKSLDDLQGLFDWDFLMNSRTPGFGEASAADAYVNQANYNNFFFTSSDKDAYVWNFKSYINNASDWADSYLVIYNTNYTLEKIDGIERTALNGSKWDNVKGSAFFYRGYYFLNLAWQYAKAYDPASFEKDLGIPLRSTSDINVPSVRATVKETYDWIINDLKQSAKYLPDHPIHPMRPSKAASYGALARTYLSMRQYDSAYKYANLSLQLKNDLLDYNSPDIDETLIIPFKPFNNEIIFYTVNPGSYAAASPISTHIDSVLYASYEENDKRKAIFFRLFNGGQRFKGNYTATTGTFFSGLATDEMYLTRAECHARANRITEAMNDLNTLLEMRWATGTFIPFSASAQDEVLALILVERRKELLMRNLRWIDIKRLNKEGAGIVLKRMVNNEVFTLEPNDDRYALPLPYKIIDITGMPQN